MKPRENELSAMAQHVVDNIVEGEPEPSGLRVNKVLNQGPSSSSYLLANQNYSQFSQYSQFSHDVDHWISNSCESPSPNTTGVAIQGSGIPTVHRSVPARRSTMDNTGLWYILALLLPLFGLGDSPQWRCTPNLVINASELLMTYIRQVCAQARAQIRMLARDRVARELFATAMDIVLVIYAIGFLILSMYQASIFG